tara:strand:+ start:19514 stop:20731 length:1218 start_codon:yes stop_codon:yes gene_type:complete
MSPEDQLVALSQRELQDGPVDLIRLCLFDWAVCAIAGREEPVAQILSHQSDVSFGNTALVYGTMGHALDYDDTHFDHIGHTSAVVMPAVLAAAQMAGICDLDHVVKAALLGAEAAVRVGLWLGRDHYQVGFHQTATSGAIGAAVGCAHLLNLSEPQTRHAIGLAATGASGLRGQFGSMGKPLNAGLAARCAVESAVWAQAGMTSDPQGVAQFGATHHGQANDSAWDVAEPWKIARINHKFHACCHGLHAMLEALQTVKGDVVAVVVQTHPRWMSVCNKPAPDTGLGVKFSYAMTAAMALSGVSTAAIIGFSDQTAKDPALVTLRDKVTVHASDQLTEMQARVAIDYADGRSETVFHDLQIPLPMAEREIRLEKKARAVVGADRSGALWAAVQGDDVSPLTRLLRA